MPIHNEAKKGEIAKTVLMPGDPLRAKYIAENFLTDYKLVNNVRGMYAYTGKYKGKEITVMALEWECQVWVYMHMNYTIFMKWKILLELEHVVHLMRKWDY